MNKDYASIVHVDSNNLGPSYIIGLGKFLIVCAGWILIVSRLQGTIQEVSSGLWIKACLISKASGIPLMGTSPTLRVHSKAHTLI